MRVPLPALCLSLALVSCGLPSAPPPTNPVRFLLVNDVYVADTLSDGSGGIARVATLKSRITAEGPVLFVLAGDVLSPSLLSKYYSGRQMVDIFNEARLDYATFGNHEFELSQDTLLARIAASKFKWLSANCTAADGAPFPGVLAFDTVRIYKHKVGLFGLTLPGDYRRYVRCANPDSAARHAIDTLSALGADLIVAVTHQTVASDRALLDREPRLDLILGGHEHEAHDVMVGTRHVLKADANARTAQFATLFGAKDAWRQAVRLIVVDAAVPLDSAVERIVRRWNDSLKVRLGPERVIGTAAVPIDGKDARSRRAESPLADVVTDAMRVGTGADVALLNAGALRLDDVIHAGPITNYQLESIFLFADESRVITFPLTGARLRELLEHGVGEGAFGKGGFPQVSGIRFTVDSSQPSGHRIVGNIERAGGGPIRPDERVTVAFDVYPACGGGDGYLVPEAKLACAASAEAPRAADLLLRHISGPLNGKVSAGTSDRIRLK